MKQSIQQELEEHVKELIQGEVLTLDNTDDWHFHAFNEDWLVGHNISAFEAITRAKEYEEYRFG